MTNFDHPVEASELLETDLGLVWCNLYSVCLPITLSFRFGWQTETEPFVRSFITLPTANPRTVFSSDSESEDSEAAEALMITEVVFIDNRSSVVFIFKARGCLFITVGPM